MEILHNGELVKSSNSSTCGALLYTVNASRADEGSYICRGLNGNAVAVTVPIGNMSVLGKGRGIRHLSCVDYKNKSSLEHESPHVL